LPTSFPEISQPNIHTSHGNKQLPDSGKKLTCAPFDKGSKGLCYENDIPAGQRLVNN